LQRSVGNEVWFKKLIRSHSKDTIHNTVQMLFDVAGKPLQWQLMSCRHDALTAAAVTPKCQSFHHCYLTTDDQCPHQRRTLTADCLQDAQAPHRQVSTSTQQKCYTEYCKVSQRGGGYSPYRWDAHLPLIGLQDYLRWTYHKVCDA